MVRERRYLRDDSADRSAAVDLQRQTLSAFEIRAEQRSCRREASDGNGGSRRHAMTLARFRNEARRDPGNQGDGAISGGRRHESVTHKLKFARARRKAPKLGMPVSHA
jgi:hypothetical protein